jgi:hypothetical protein
LLATLAGSRPAVGQSISADPYDPWNYIYRPFVFPTAPLNPGMPNQGKEEFLESPRNQFGQYLESIGVANPDPFGRSGRPSSRFTPYYMNYQQGRGAYDRTYVPNKDDKFYDDQQSRQERYLQAQAIKDPKERAEALRRIRAETIKAARANYSRRPQARAPQAPEVEPGTGTERAPGGSTSRPGAAATRRRDDTSRSRGLLEGGLLGTPEESAELRSNTDTLRRSRGIGRRAFSDPVTGRVPGLLDDLPDDEPEATPSQPATPPDEP